MPEKDENKQEIDELKVRRKPEAVSKASQKDAVEPRSAMKRRRKIIGGAIVLVIVVVGLLIAGGILIMNGISNQTAYPQRFDRFRGGYGYAQPMVEASPYGYGTSVQTTVDNGSVSTTVYTYLTGVVVAVNSGNIVIAGNGKQTTIQTNSSTTYDNGTKPAVNDTVTIVGTTSGSTTTATEIGVNN